MFHLNANGQISSKDLDRHKEEGVRDRAAGLPRLDSDDPEGTPLHLIHTAKAGILDRFRLWTAQHRRQKDEIGDLQNQIAQLQPSQTYADTMHGAQEKILAGEDTQWGQSEAGQARASERSTRAEYYRLRAQEKNRPLNAHLHPWAYFAVMALLSVLEFPINVEAATAIFPDIPLMIWILTALVGIILILYAHMTGRLLKQRSVMGLTFLPSLIFWIAIPLFSAFAIAAIYFLRWRRMDLQNLLPDSGELLFFLFLNLSIYLFGVVTSVLHYDRNPAYQTAHRHWIKARAKLDRLERKRRDAHEGLENSRSAAWSENFLNRENLQGDLARAESERQKSRQDWTHYLDSALGELRIQLGLYAQGNIVPDPQAPKRLPHWLTQDGIEAILADIRNHFTKKADECA